MAKNKSILITVQLFLIIIVAGTHLAAGLDIYLSDLQWTSMTNNHGPATLDACFNGGPITLDGIQYVKGLGTHAESTITYNIPPGCTNFRARVGIDDSRGDYGSVFFRVLLDNNLAYTSPRITGTTLSSQVDIMLGSASTITLHVDPDSDTSRDVTDWADAKFICNDQTPPPATILEGDINSDGIVNILDIQIVVLHFGKITGYPGNVNLASPTSIDLFDAMVVVRNWGRTNSPTDTTAPTLSNGAPSGTLASGTASTTLALSTNEPATCRYSITANTAYASMTNTFTTTGSTTHSRVITGLSNGQTYNYYIRCIDGTGNANTNDYTITFSVATGVIDTTAPSQTSGLTASAISSSQINLAWNAATDNMGVSGYRIYRNGAQIATTTQTSYSNTGLSPSTTYSYTVAAYDSSGNIGLQSASAVATTQSQSTTPGTILLQEGFENTNFASRGWYDNILTPVSITDRYSGTASARYRWAQGQQLPDTTQGTGGLGAMRHTFTPTNSVYVSYWVKYSTNYVGSGRSYHPHEIMLMTTLSPDTSAPAYSYMTAYIEQNYGTVGGVTGGVPRVSMQDSRNIDLNAIGQNLIGVTENRAVAGCNGAPADGGHMIADCYTLSGTRRNEIIWTSPSVQFSNNAASSNYKGNWNRVEAYYQMNTITNGVANQDGVIKYWFNGQLIIDRNNVYIRTGQNPTMQWSQILLAPYIGDGSPADQTMWIDDLVVATSPPGSTPPPPSDTTPPTRSNGAPSGTLASGTTSTTLSLSTNEPATCRYSTTPNTAYTSMTNTFTTTGATTHSRTITGLANGQTYNYYVRCQDSTGNANTNDYTITYNIATSGSGGGGSGGVNILMEIPHNTAPYSMYWNNRASSQQLIQMGGAGPKAPGNLWNYQHFTSGGYNNGPYMRYNWWDWDVSGVGQDADQAGWTASGSAFRPTGGWQLNVPYYLRFRMRINAPLLQHPSGTCDDSQMKWFIWNAYTALGTDRAIMMLHSGADFGGNENTQTAIQLRAGVSGSWAVALIPNGQWTNVQLAFRGGPEGTAFQRIYINNNNEAIPTAQNTIFADLPGRTWGFGTTSQGLDNQFMWGDIANTGSCVREDAQIDVMDMQLSTSFDPNWHS